MPGSVENRTCRGVVTLTAVSRYVFDGDISGFGTQSGTRLVVGHWTASPLGEFTDVMVEFADGERLLLAPSPEVRDFVTATYTFDRHEIVDVVHRRVDDRVSVEAGDLRLGFTVGSVTLLGRLLAVMPDAVVTAPWFCTLSDPIARVLLSGVRTRGTAGGGRREFYGARGQHRIVSARPRPGAGTTWAVSPGSNRRCASDSAPRPQPLLDGRADHRRGALSSRRARWSGRGCTQLGRIDGIPSGRATCGQPRPVVAPRRTHAVDPMSGPSLFGPASNTVCIPSAARPRRRPGDVPDRRGRRARGEPSGRCASGVPRPRRP